MVARDAQRFEPLDDLSVEPPLGAGRAPGEAVHRHQRRVLGLGQPRRRREAVRLMHQQPHMLVLPRNLERRHQRRVHRVDDRGLFRTRPLTADLDEHPGHGVPLHDGRAVLSARDRPMHSDFWPSNPPA